MLGLTWVFRGAEHSFVAAVLRGAFLYQVQTGPLTHFHLFHHTTVFWVILLHERWMPLLTYLFVLPYAMQWLFNPNEKAHKNQIYPAMELWISSYAVEKNSTIIKWKSSIWKSSAFFFLWKKILTQNGNHFAHPIADFTPSPLHWSTSN